MKKNEFLEQLQTLLSGLEPSEREGSLEYYRELIDDRMEEGLDEAAAVAAVGTPAAAAQAILGELPLPRLVKARVRPRRRLSAWEIVLLVLGSPIWLSLLIAVLSVLISLYAVLWAVVISLWAAELSLGAGALVGLPLFLMSIVEGHFGAGVMYLGGALLLAGFAIFAFFGCLQLTKGLLALSRRFVLWIKLSLIGKETMQ
ncbi:MAG: DUF1700 domain-containing protein [Clostridia bacterium]|nr:DUF1700 domain-containing protein [Clostridia bacterium]